MKRFKWIGVFVVSAQLWSPLAQAFTLISQSNSSFEGWARKTLTFRVNYENCPVDVEALNFAIDSAVQTWNSVDTSGIKIERGESTSTTIAESQDGSDQNPVIHCDPDFDNEPELVVGLGFVTIDKNQITDGYILLNAAADTNGNISTKDIEKIGIIIAHEMGHVLGLGHAGDDATLMYFNASAKEELRLAQDDIDGITYLYPRSELGGGDKFLGCGSIALLGRGGSEGSSGGDGPGGLGGGAGGIGSSSAQIQFALMLLICFLVTRLMKRRVYSCQSAR